MTNITFYHYTGEQNRINKTLENGIQIPCNFNIEYNLINPTIRIASNKDVSYNYCFIPELNRYYFIDRCVIKRGGYYELYLTLDVLQTYKDKILNLYGTVTRSKTSLYLEGNNLPVTSHTKIKKYEFNDVFNHDGTYVMITSGYVGE